MPEIRSMERLVINGNRTNLALVRFNPKGWILASIENVVQPIYGYDFDSEFDAVDIKTNPNMGFLLDVFEKNIQRIKNQGVVEADSRWNDENVTLRSAQTANDITPLIKVNWNQGTGWNASCPADANANGSGGHVWVGCVAVAMGQAMTVYQKPIAGTGYKTYMHSTYGRQTVNFDTYGNYDWSKIVDGTTSANPNIADFLYHCGVTVEMDYGADGSGTYVRRVASALSTYFGYATTTKVVDRLGSVEEWTTLLNSELNSGRPIIYGGDAGDGKAGHAFNIDGVNLSSGFYHLNWGWSGSNNDYFSINNLAPGLYDFTKNQSAVVGIRPPNPGPTDISLSNSSVNAGKPAGTVIGDFVVTDEIKTNTYTYYLDGGFDIFDEPLPLNFYEENGQVKTKKSFIFGSALSNTQTFQVTVIDKFNNSYTKTITVNILDYVAVNSVAVSKNQKVMYDPNAHRLLFGDEIDRKVSIHSMDGKLILNTKMNDSSLDVSGIAPGIYLGIVQTSTDQNMFKFIIK